MLASLTKAQSARRFEERRPPQSRDIGRCSPASYGLGGVAQRAGLAIDLTGLCPPHRMRTIRYRFQTDTFDPAMHQRGILSGGQVRAPMKSTREQISRASRPEYS